MGEQNEQGSKMTAERALSLYKANNTWLRNQLAGNVRCFCGSCHLCAYRFLETLTKAQPPSPEERE